MDSIFSKSNIISAFFLEIYGAWRNTRNTICNSNNLARLLLPKDFGLIALVMVFISLANVFVQSGFNTALIQKKDSNENDFSSVLFLSLFISLLTYILIFLTSDYIASFYVETKLKLILKVLPLTLFLGAFNSVQIAYVAKHMMFKKLFFSSIGAVSISGIIGISCAYQGLGVWALVIQQIVSQFSVSVILWFTVKWRPHFSFSLSRVSSLFNFAWKLLLTNLIYVLYMDLRTLVIGKIYNPSVLAYYYRGENFPKFIVNNIDGSIQSVMFPVFSAHQDNLKKMKNMVRRSVVTSSFIVFPAMVGLAAVAEPLVSVLLTDKWLLSVPFLQIFCLSYAMIPTEIVNLQAISALGRSDITLKLQIIKNIIGITILFASIPYGIYAIAVGYAFSSFLGMLVNIYPNKIILNYGYFEQLKDVLPNITISIVMGVVIYLIKFFNFHNFTTLICQLLSGVFVYLLLAKIFGIETLHYLITTLKDRKSVKI